MMSANSPPHLSSWLVCGQPRDQSTCRAAAGSEPARACDDKSNFCQNRCAVIASIRLPTHTTCSVGVKDNISSRGCDGFDRSTGRTRARGASGRPFAGRCARWRERLRVRPVCVRSCASRSARYCIALCVSPLLCARAACIGRVDRSPWWTPYGTGGMTGGTREWSVVPRELIVCNDV